MDDHSLIRALSHEYCPLFCGGHESTDPAIALAFVRFVLALPASRVHPDDVAENHQANYETKPRWSAEALEYVFSDSSEADHAELVCEFFATLSEAHRTLAWSSVRTQVVPYIPDPPGDAERPLLAALDDRVRR